jgi:hypothetical protein
MEPNPKLPIYLVDIDDTDETGVDFIAQTSDPAIEKNFLAFNKSERVNHSFKTTAEDRRIITGPLMIPNLPIYRRDEQGEYYVMFSKQAIEKIAYKFMKNGFIHNVNLEHDPNRLPDGVFGIEFFIADKTRGIPNPAGWPDLPDGTWFGSYKIENDEFWNEFIKTGVFKGFSVEGTFLHKYICPKPIDELEAIRSEVLTLSKLLDLLNA